MTKHKYTYESRELKYESLNLKKGITFQSLFFYKYNDIRNSVIEM